MEKIIISNPEKIKIIKNEIIDGGKENLHIISDFDRTLTQAYSDGKYRASLISVLYEEGYLSKKYQKTAQGFFAYYHTIEVDNNISIEDKKELWKNGEQSIKYCG